MNAFSHWPHCTRLRLAPLHAAAFGGHEICHRRCPARGRQACRGTDPRRGLPASSRESSLPCAIKTPPSFKLPGCKICKTPAEIDWGRGAEIWLFLQGAGSLLGKSEAGGHSHVGRVNMAGSGGRRRVPRGSARRPDLTQQLLGGPAPSPPSAPLLEDMNTAEYSGGGGCSVSRGGVGSLGGGVRTHPQCV